MDRTVKRFDELTTAELYEILRVRSAVFVVEQECIYQDIDDIDQESWHVFFHDEDGIQAYLRFFIKKDEDNTVKAGRVLTMQRGIGLGERLVRESIDIIKETLCPDRIFIEAQSYAKGFYELAGFRVCSDEFLEDGIPHVEMELFLNGKESGQR